MSKPVCTACSESRVLTKALAPARRTNEPAICVTAKVRWRRAVLLVVRTLPLARLRPSALSAEGRRGTKARITAATKASAAPTHRRLKSTLRSRARTEKREV